MRLGLPLAFASYWDASVLLGNGLEGDLHTGFRSKHPARACGTVGPPSWPSSWHLSACCWILTPWVCLFHLCLLDTVSSPLLQRALPRPPHFLLLDEDLAHCCLMLFSCPLSAASMPSPNIWLHLRDS